LKITDRLDLFIQVVTESSMHIKTTSIHRDLKPANIPVVDGSGVRRSRAVHCDRQLFGDAWMRQSGAGGSGNPRRGYPDGRVLAGSPPVWFADGLTGCKRPTLSIAECVIYRSCGVEIKFLPIIVNL